MVSGPLASPREMTWLWREHPRGFLHEFLLIVVGLGFLVSPEPLWSDIFYAGILPLFLYETAKGRGVPPLHTWPPVLGLGVALIAWFSVGILTHATGWHEAGSACFWLWNMLNTTVYVLVLTDALMTRPDFRERLMQVLIAAATLNAVIAFARLPFHMQREWEGSVLRMEGWAETKHQILGATIMGAVLLMAQAEALRTGNRRYWLAGLTVLAFIVLTGSRGPLLAVGAASLVLFGLQRPKVLLVPAAASVAMAGLAWLSPTSLPARMIREQLGRGDSHRLRIWHEAWDAIGQAFWVGHGPSYKLSVPGESFPHNLLLSTWLYAGVIGVALLGAYLACVLGNVLAPQNRARRPLGLALVVHTLLSAMTDFGQVIKGPSPMWYMFWLTTLVAACPVARLQPDKTFRSTP